MTEVRDTGNAYKSVVDINIVHVPCSKIFLVFIPRTGQQIQRYTIIQQDCYMFRPFSAIFSEKSLYVFGNTCTALVCVIISKIFRHSEKIRPGMCVVF